MIKKIQNLLHARSGRNSQVPNSVRAVSFILSVVLTTAGIGYAVALAANTVIGNNIVTSGNLTVGGTTTFNTIAYTWPAADGGAGETLTTDGAGNLSWSAGGGSLFTDGGATTRLTSTDNLGVGTTSTAFKLGIQGNALFSGDISAANMVATGSLNITDPGTDPAEIYLNTNGVNVALLGGHSNNSFDIFMNGMPGTPSFFLSSVGLMGVATDTPSQRLSVQGNGFFSGDITSVAGITATGTITIGHSATTSAMLYVSDGTATGTPGMPGLSTAVPAWFVSNSSVPVMGMENTSIGVKVGMAAFSDDDGPHATFSTFTNSALSFEVNTGSGNSTSAIWITTGSNIGIGTSTPSEKLSVIGNITMSGSILPILSPDDTASTSRPSASSTIAGLTFDAVPSGHAMAIGTDGFPVFAYRNVDTSSLVVTKCGDSDCFSATTTTTVVSGTVGGGDQSISMAIDRNGLPIITYSEAVDLTLHLVRCATVSCSSIASDQFIDGVDGVVPGPNVSTSTSVVIPADNQPVISYYDETNGELRFANCANGACSSFGTSTLDGAGVTDVGAFNSMAVLSDDSLIMAYYDITNGNLKTVKCKSASCGGGTSPATADSDAADIGKYTSVAVATNGAPVISYYDASNGDLKVVSCGDALCSGFNGAATLDSASDVGKYSSIAIGTDGFPIISYYDLSNTKLKTLKCSDVTCSSSPTGALITDIDTDNVGKYSTIAINPDGMPIVAYYATAETNVRMFKCNTQNCTGLGTGYLVGGSDLGSLGKFFNNAYVESLWAKQISIKRFDLAEDYYSREELNPGEIVSLDPSEALHIKKASNDGSRVIGIVSTEPALVLSDFTAPASNDKNYPIALAGRVPVKVNSEGGSIAIGDPIALSSVSGMGKRAAEEEKTIGYALDSFSGTAGTIRVFVNLNGDSGSSDSSGSLLGQVIGVVQNWLEGMKVTVADGLMTLKDLVAERITALGVTTIDLKVGTAETPSGITLFDKNTSLPYCVTVADGQLQTAAGECVSSVSSTTAPTDPSTDTTAPVITLSGSAIIETPRGSAWSDPGATVVDPASGSNPENTNLSIYYNVDGTDTANEGRELPTIDTTSNGLHTITYTSTDSSGNVGTVSRIVNVVNPL